MRGPRTFLLALAGAAVALAGCSMLPWPSTPVEAVNPELPLGVQVVTPPDEMRLGVSNQTAIPVTVEVNGVLVREMELDRRLLLHPVAVHVDGLEDPLGEVFVDRRR